ncbi:MAG: amidase [Pseudomonadota bacterium]
MSHLPPGFVDTVSSAIPPKAGARLAVKDMIAVKGCRQTAGLPAYAHRRADSDAAVVRRFTNAGYQVVGTTVTDCAGFGTMTDGLQNPIDPHRAVGGSSGGAAVALMAGAADVALGTDTGGSVRIPAAYCELYAFKPSLGVVPMDGVVPLAPSFDVVGVLAASRDSLIPAAHTLIGANPLPPKRSPVIAVDGDGLDALDASLKALFHAVADGFGASTTIRRHTPFMRLARAHGAIACAEALTVHGRAWRADASGFPGPIAMALHHGAAATGEETRRARAVLGEVKELHLAALDASGADVVLAPTLPMPPAPRYAKAAVVEGRLVPITHANIRLTLNASIVGLPVVVAPIGGLSVQLIGRQGADAQLLADAAVLLEHVAPHRARGT